MRWIDRGQFLRQNWMISSLGSQQKEYIGLPGTFWWSMDFTYLVLPLQLPVNLPLIQCLFFLQMPLFMTQWTNFGIRTSLQWPLVHLETQLLSVTMKIDSGNQWSSRGIMLQFVSLLFLHPLLVHMLSILYPHFLVPYLPIT